MTKGRTVLIMKDNKKDGVAINHRLILCLPIRWKLLTGIIGNEISGHLERSSLLQNKQKGCRRGSSGVKLLTDKTMELQQGKEKSSLRISISQESIRHGAPFLVKRDTKISGSSRQHPPSIRSDHA